MAWLIALPILIVAMCLLYALVYSLLYERNKSLLLKEKYRKKHQQEVDFNAQKQIKNSISNAPNEN